MIIQKFGGTSLQTPGRFANVGNIISSVDKKIVILSAIGKTTDDLQEICDLLDQNEIGPAEKQINAFEKQYQTFIDELFKTENHRGEARSLLETHIRFIKSFTVDMFTAKENRILLAQGELISTALMNLFLQENGIKSHLLQSLDLLRLNENSEPDIDRLKKKLCGEIAAHPKDQLFISQGYICRDIFGEIDNLHRGGSDYSATLFGAAIDADEIQIWTDIDGMHNSDPRYVKNTRPLRRLSFEEAAELAYFGASILHPASVHPAKEKNIPVRILNTMEPDKTGTVLTRERGEGEFKAVAAKDGLTAIKIHSSRMLQAFGFLRKIFDVFELYQTPIDLIATSEVDVSLTIDNCSHLPELLKELRSYGEVTVDKNQTIICVVGDFVAEEAGKALKILSALKEIPLRMISYGGSKNNISILISSEFKVKALNDLHRALFNA